MLDRPAQPTRGPRPVQPVEQRRGRSGAVGRARTQQVSSNPNTINRSRATPPRSADPPARSTPSDFRSVSGSSSKSPGSATASRPPASTGGSPPSGRARPPRPSPPLRNAIRPAFEEEQAPPPAPSKSRASRPGQVAGPGGHLRRVGHQGQVDAARSPTRPGRSTSVANRAWELRLNLRSWISYRLGSEGDGLVVVCGRASVVLLRSAIENVDARGEGDREGSGAESVPRQFQLRSRALRPRRKGKGSTTSARAGDQDEGRRRGEPQSESGRRPRSPAGPGPLASGPSRPGRGPG